MNDIENSFLKTEECIRLGQSRQAHQIIFGLFKSNKKLSILEQIKMGNLLSRCGDFASTLQLLHSHIQSETLDPHLKSLARIEYAATLVQIGLITEANELLLPLNEFKYPEASLNRALGLFQEWNYSDAIPLLETWVRHPSLTEYRRLVGRINLSIAYAFAAPEKLKLTEIDSIEQQIKDNNYTLLFGGWAQIKGRYLTEQKQFDLATQVFNDSLEKIKNVTTWDRLYLLKWNLVCQIKREQKPLGHFKRDGRQKKFLDEFKSLRAMAMSLHDYETVRDCDFHISNLFDHRGLKDYCYHGTPFQSFRDRFSETSVSNKVRFYLTPTGIQSEASNLFGPNGTLRSQNSILKRKVNVSQSRAISFENLSSVFHLKNDKKLFAGGVLEKTLSAFFADFYRPMTVHRLFGIIYQGNHWNQNSSPTQVRQALFRLRQWLKENKNDFQIYENKASYKLVSNKKWYLINKTLSKDSEDQKILTSLQKHLTASGFSFAEFQKAIQAHSSVKISPRTQRRWLQSFIQQGLVLKTGNTKSALFRIAQLNT